jgi:hypothetical protein
VCALRGFQGVILCWAGVAKVEVVADCGFKLVTTIGGALWHSMLGLLERLVERILFALLGYGSASLARCLVHVLVVI